MQHIYFGIFQDFKYLYRQEILEIGIYDDEFVDFYNMINASDDEINKYNDFIQPHGKSILELCCGNGRLTIPLAKLGYRIDGYDISIDMLSVLKNKIQSLSTDIQSNIQCKIGNVFDIVVEKKYDCIILPASTISILSDNVNKLINLFNKISGWLKKDGIFIFDYNIYISEKSKSELSSIAQKNNTYSRWICFQDFINYIPGRAIGNFYIQKEYKEGTSRKYITSTNKRIITKDFIQNIVDISQLKLIYQEPMEGNSNSIVNILKAK